MRRNLLLVVAVSLACLTPAGRIAAEPFADLYLGAAITSDPDFTVTAGTVSVDGKTEIERSFVIGARAGYWLDALPWLGFAIDVSYFRLDEKGGAGAAEGQAVPLSALLMLRVPVLTSPQFPKGQLQPYVGIGPGVFFTDIDFDLGAAGLRGRFSDNSVDLGLDARLGVAWLFQKNIALFGEYRFTHVKPEYKGTVIGVRETLEIEYNTHHLAVGVSFRF